MFNYLIIFSAQYLYLLVILIATIYFFFLPRNRQKDLIILTVTGLPFIYLASRAAAYFYFDPRPFVAGHFMPLIPHTPDNGFPSDHALLTSAIAAIIFFYNKKVSRILWLLAVIVGASRVLAGVHNWIDVIGAIILSAAIASLAEYWLLNSKIISYKK